MTKYQSRILWNVASLVLCLHVLAGFGWSTWHLIYREPSGLAVITAIISILAAVASYSFARDAVRCLEAYLKYHL